MTSGSVAPKRLFALAALCGAAGFGVPVASGQVIVVSFEDLATPPALTDFGRLEDASGTGTTYAGIVWDTRARVAGANYKVDTFTPGPNYGIPRTGSYYLSNDDSAPLNGDSITLTTTMVLTGGWFGQNEYYGFGGGADQITIRAMNGATELGSVTFDLPESNDGQPEPLSFVDTSTFLGLTGITGYEIDHRPRNSSAHNWVADDLTFQAVPEPEAVATWVAAGLAGWAVVWRSRARRGGRVTAAS